jgi:hypothetical protein
MLTFDHLQTLVTERSRAIPSFGLLLAKHATDCLICPSIVSLTQELAKVEAAPGHSIDFDKIPLGTMLRILPFHVCHAHIHLSVHTQSTPVCLCLCLFLSVFLSLFLSNTRTPLPTYLSLLIRAWRLILLLSSTSFLCFISFDRTTYPWVIPRSCLTPSIFITENDQVIDEWKTAPRR